MSVRLLATGVALQVAILVVLVAIVMQLMDANDRGYADSQVLKDTCQAVVAAAQSSNNYAQGYAVKPC